MCRNDGITCKPRREAAPSELCFLRLKGFLKYIQFSTEHGSGQAAPGIKGQRKPSIDTVTLSGLPHARAGGKKYYPEGGDFLSPAREALAGGKKPFKQKAKRTPLSRPHTHNCGRNTV